MLFEIKRWFPSAVLLFTAVYLLFSRGEYHLIDNANLVIHEGGHFVFMFFGKFIHALGGTLMQILLPGLIAFYFFSKYYRLGYQLGVFWIGQNLMNISVYAADAQARKLPLLGGDKVYHDWHYLLGEIGILEYSEEVGYFFVGLAVICFFFSIMAPYYMTDYESGIKTGIADSY